VKPLRTAILGCGGFANRHAENIASMPSQLELAAFCDTIPEHAQAFAQKYAKDAKIYTDFHPMLDEARLDLLVICLPPFGHTDEVDAAAGRGIHLLIEKPVALTTEQAWKMVAAAESARIKTQVGFMFRFGAAVTELKSLIDSGKAGPLGLMSARYFCNALHADWWRRRDKSGGQLVEQVIHMVDLMRYLMGDPITVYSLQNNLFHRDVADYTVEDVSGTVIGFKNGGIGVIYASNGAIPGKWINDYRLVARNLTAEFSDANHATFTYTGGPYLQNVSISSDQDYYRLELSDLLKAIETGGDTRTPLREGALSLDLALAATRSAESAAVVKL
jgi:predicted dehydrogenase